MKEFILTVVTAGIASGVIGLFFEDDAEIGKYIRLVLSVCFLSAVIPGGINLVSSIFGDGGFHPETGSFDSENCEHIYEEYVIECAKQSLEDELCKKIFENTGIKAQDVNIQFNVTRTEETTDVDISEITVLIPSGDGHGSVSEIVKELCGKEPEIILTNTG